MLSGSKGRLATKCTATRKQVCKLWPDIDCSCFLSQASLFFLLCPLVVVFSDHKGLIHTVSSEQLMFRCVCYLNCVKHLFRLQSEAVNSNELILCSRCNSGSSFPVAVLKRASFIIALDGFCDCTWRNVQSSYFLDWLTFMFKVMMDCPFSLLIWAVLAIIWTWSFSK